VKSDLAIRIRDVRTQVNILRGRREAAHARVLQLNTEVSRLEGEEQISDIAGGVLRALIDDEVSISVKAVEDLLTDGLRAVFDDQDLSVKANVEVQRGKVSVDLVTIQRQSDGSVTTGLSRDAFGGAVTTVQSVLLRTIVIVRRGMRPIMFLDESLPAFDANYVGNMGAFLRALCAKLGMDILLVSHNPAMVEAADRAYRISKIDGRATFKRVR